MRPGETVSTVTQACNRDRTPPIPTPHPETAKAAVRAFEQFKMACDAMRWIFASARTTMAAEEPRLSHEIPRTCSARWPHLQRAGPRQCVFKPDFLRFGGNFPDRIPKFADTYSEKIQLFHLIKSVENVLSANCITENARDFPVRGHMRDPDRQSAVNRAVFRGRRPSVSQVLRADGGKYSAI